MSPVQPQSNTKQALIEKMGGIDAASGVLISAVEILYAKLVSDPILAVFFEGVEMERIKKKQVEFLAYAFGGPMAYTGKDLYEAHERLIKERGLNETHFDILVQHFRDTLTELNLEPNLIEEAVDVVNAARPVFQVENAIKDDKNVLQSLQEKADTMEEAGGREKSPELDEEKIHYITTQLCRLIHDHEEELEHTRSKLRVMLSSQRPSSLGRVRNALQIRDPGLVKLFDKITQGEPMVH